MLTCNIAVGVAVDVVAAAVVAAAVVAADIEAGRFWRHVCVACKIYCVGCSDNLFAIYLHSHLNAHKCIS